MKNYKYIILISFFLLITCLKAENIKFKDSLFGGFLAGIQFNQKYIKFSGDNNSFFGKIFIKDVISEFNILKIGTQTGECEKKLRGLYLNNARGMRVWPLDTETLFTLQLLDDSFDSLEINGGLYTDCEFGSGVYGYLEHNRQNLNYNLIAGVDININNNTYTNIDMGTLKIGEYYSLSGYIRDDYGGVGKIYDGYTVDNTVCFDGIGIKYLNDNYGKKIFCYKSKGLTYYNSDGDVINSGYNINPGEIIKTYRPYKNLRGETIKDANVNNFPIGNVDGFKQGNLKVKTKVLKPKQYEKLGYISIN